MARGLPLAHARRELDVKLELVAHEPVAARVDRKHLGGRLGSSERQAELEALRLALVRMHDHRVVEARHERVARNERQRVRADLVAAGHRLELRLVAGELLARVDRELVRQLTLTQGLEAS